MAAQINDIITGKYNYIGDSVIYCDTDSVFFSVPEAMLLDAAVKETFKDFPWDDRAQIVMLYDMIADAANETFPAFMMKTFNTSEERGAIIRAGRELIGSKALFIKKKKYAILMYDKDGERLDVNGKPGKIKAMGLDLKRADTPKFMQEFLSRLLMGVLTGVEKNDMFGWIKEFRKEFRKRPGWEKGTPKGVKGLAVYSDRIEESAVKQIGRRVERHMGKVNMPGHVKASLNWNKLCEVNEDLYAMQIGDGNKIVVCKLRKGNQYGMDSVAYPVDEPHLPVWFKTLPFNHAAMEDSIIDKKLMNLVGVLNWDLNETHERVTDKFFVFAQQPDTVEFDEDSNWDEDEEDDGIEEVLRR